MYNFSSIFTDICCTCTLSLTVHFQMYRKDVQFYRSDVEENVHFFSFKCTTRCTDLIFENGDHIRGPPRQQSHLNGKNRPRRAIFVLTVAHWLKSEGPLLRERGAKLNFAPLQAYRAVIEGFSLI